MSQRIKDLLTKAEAGDLAACAELEAELMIDVEWLNAYVECIEFSSVFSATAFYKNHEDHISAKMAAVCDLARQILESEE